MFYERAPGFGRMGLPVLVVPNDANFLALLCPLALTTGFLVLDGVQGFPLLSKFADRVVDTRISLWIMAWAHNLYLELLAERGIFGFAAFAALLGTALAVALRTWQKQTGEVKLLTAGALASLCGFLFSGIYETSLIRVWAVVLLCTLLGTIGSLASLPEPGEDDA